jgi:hypothetical protein
MTTGPGSRLVGVSGWTRPIGILVICQEIASDAGVPKTTMPYQLTLEIPRILTLSSINSRIGSN